GERLVLEADLATARQERDSAIGNCVEQVRKTAFQSERAENAEIALASALHASCDNFDAITRERDAARQALAQVQGNSILDDDAGRFLDLLLQECGGRADSPSWRQCRRCVAMNELEQHWPLAQRMVEHARNRLKQFADIPPTPQEAR